MKKYLFLCSVFAVFFVFGSISARAQSDLTWNELKAQQNVERTSMENMQKETLQNVVELQKLQFEKLRSETSANANDLLMLADKLKAERVELNKQFADERTKLVQIHADERKAFLAKPKS
jgi:hypothetical protein